MAFCLTKQQENKLREAFLSGKLNPMKLAEMSSADRRAEFEKFIDKNNAQQVNSLFESKLLLKNQIQGFKTWAKSLVGVSPKVKRDLNAKIDRLNELGVLDPADMKSFREDLARTRLGFGVSMEEAQEINRLSADREKAKEAWEAVIKKNKKWEDDPYAARQEWIDDPKRAEYGLRQVLLENYVNDIKIRERGRRADFRESPVRSLANVVKDSPGFLSNLFKSTMSSLDNSFFGRQGIKNLYGTPSQKRIWARNFVKSFNDIGSELTKKKVNGLEPIDMIKADIYSRPNALSGKYKAGNYRLDVLTEEVFPTSLPEKVPGLGRLFRASETAFNGGALRMRSDLADMLISQMEAQGINALDPKNAKPAGNFVGALTGRGNLGRLTPLSDQLNLILWSARFFKANVDTLISPAKFAATKLGLKTVESEGEAFIEKKAAQNMVSVVGHVAGLMMMAQFLWGEDAVDLDPRSTNFGRVKIFDQWIDITGGMRTIAIMAARLVPTRRDGEWGVWRKSSSGTWTNLTAGEFGKDDAVDVFMDTILLNRLAPMASIVRDYYRGEMFGGDPFDIEKSIINSLTPLSIQNFNEVKDENIEAVLATIIADSFGFGVSTYKYKSNWEKSTSKEMKEFKKQVGEEKFKDANNAYNIAYNAWLDAVREDPRYQELSEESKKKLESQARSAIKEKILKEYGYVEVKKQETVEELREKETIKSLRPK